MSDSAIDWVSQRIPEGRTVVSYAAGRIPPDADPRAVLTVANMAAEVVQRHPAAEKLPAAHMALMFLTVPLADVPKPVFSDGRDRSVDLAVIAVAHMPEGAARTGGWSGRQEHMFPPLGWEDR